MDADDAPPVADGNYGVLPADMLYYILLCLPANHLCRLRLVCLSWRSLTSDPLFARAHSSRHPHVAALHCYLQALDVMDLHDKIVVRRIYLRQPSFCLVAQHNLICVGYTHAHYTAWRRGACVLSLQQGTGSTIADLSMEHDMSGRCRMPPTFKLGHVPSTGEYKVIHLYMPMAPDNSMAMVDRCHVMTLGSGDGRWREMRKPPDSCRVAVVSGVAYFLADQCCSDMEPDSIASFDLATEEWRSRILQGPVQPSTKDEVRMLVELGDCLVMVHHNLKDLITDLWFIEDMNKSLWTKRCSIRWGATLLGVKRIERVRPLMVSDDGRIVFWIPAGAGVIGAYDPRTSTWVDLAKMGHYLTVATHQGMSLLLS
ncbi:hypothetical protein SETIT_3G399000v2 [Setaria italica]|uniref:F-box domain-containing protein n=1 Tax=Setaria italica TaxID=4555 RepID=K3ZF40_SETIT|nr:hypothetical protein SETIT_3G399000v2 [Setaria italica]